MKSACNDLELGESVNSFSLAHWNLSLSNSQRKAQSSILPQKISTEDGKYQDKALLSPTKKGYEENSLEVSNNETSEQSFRKPVMLKEFFPQEFFDQNQVTVGVHMLSYEKLSEHEKPRVSVFDRLGMPQTRKSVFDRLSVRSSRQKGVIQAGGSVFDRMASSNASTTKALLEHEWKDDKETCSHIPSRMKRHLLLEIDTNGPLK
ncbi:hypothetical protein COLO4_21781 [Corchorus olitorius]|uniref:Uncharacterized protein n=1 Tax=Corchorus olitorius TaxID=93759 RepID=A0A1R3IR23_9ROSI|nr:hypothetical protein COLO4_21781 [Corchorus olitorius]